MSLYVYLYKYSTGLICAYLFALPTLRIHSRTHSDASYYFVMENGGDCTLLDFAFKAHESILKGYLEISQWHKVIKIVSIQLLNAIDYMHSKSICHFDISMENILIKIEGMPSSKKPINIEESIRFRYNPKNITAKICDFGLAQRMVDNFESSRFVGKERYCSPEIAKRAKPFNAKSNDIWWYVHIFAKFDHFSLPFFAHRQFRRLSFYVGNR